MRLILLTAVLYHAFYADDLNLDSVAKESNKTEFEIATDKLITSIQMYLFKKRNSLGMDLTKLKLCKCSIDYGCHGRTRGGFEADHSIFPPDWRDIYHDICFTDGKCYQSAHADGSKYQPGFGCIDKNYFTDSDPFTAMTFCHTHDDNLWNCCDDGSFCANRTAIVPLYNSRTNVIVQTIFTLGIPFLLLALLAMCFIMRNINGERRYWLCSLICPKIRLTDTTVQVELQALNEDVTDASDQTRVEDLSLSINPPTQSSMMSSTEETSTSCDVIGIHEQLFKDLESTGSGSYGPMMLTERTIGMQIAIEDRIGKGRFGTVSLGHWKGEDVAVKKFQSCDESSWQREVAIFQTNMLRHPNVLRYIGSDRLNDGCMMELILVTEYHPNGSLNDFLMLNSVDLHSAYSLMRSAANGLAFIHAEISALKTSTKPAIAHRDIKSKNIMVKSDMTCAIGDLGLAVTYNASTGNLDVPSNVRCGTVRYLAPEILSNTLQKNLFDSYRMADIYALSLVMWEILVRTDTEEHKAQEPEAMLPYDGLVERTPTIEEMCEVVYNKKLRPYVPAFWKNELKYNRLFDIIEECWQPNPTARLSALQIRMKMEKSQHLQFLKPKEPTPMNYVLPQHLHQSKEAPPMVGTTGVEERPKLLRSKSFSGL